MPDKTTQILKEIEAEFDSIKEAYSLSALKNYMMPRITQALAQQQQEDDQDVLDLDIMQDEEVYKLKPVSTNRRSKEAFTRRVSEGLGRNRLRMELRQAIARKRGKV